jgi:hypothetical protein
VAGALGVATASRDKTLRLWPFAAAGAAPDAAGAFGEPTVFVGHAHYVTALAWAPPGALAGGAAPAGALVSGGRDASVIVWDPSTATPLQRLQGHAQQARARGCARRRRGCCAARAARRVAAAARPRRGRGRPRRDADTEGRSARAPLPRQVSAVAVTAAGELASGDLGGEIRVWRAGACTQARARGALHAPCRFVP